MSLIFIWKKYLNFHQILIEKNKYKNANARSLKSTQKYYNETKSLTSIEIKEFSFLYIIIKQTRIYKR